MMDEMSQVTLMVGRLEGKLDQLIHITEARTIETTQELESHSTRLNKLETYKAYLIGLGTIVGAVVGTVVSILFSWYTKK